MNKLEAYKHLSKIGDTGVNVVNEVKLVASSKDEIPMSVLRFIDKYYKQRSLETFDHIYESRHKNKLYKNLVDENASIAEKSVALSLYESQCMIKLKSLNESERINYIKETYLEECYTSLHEYIKEGDSTYIINMHNKLRSKLKELYHKE